VRLRHDQKSFQAAAIAPSCRCVYCFQGGNAATGIPALHSECPSSSPASLCRESKRATQGYVSSISSILSVKSFSSVSMKMVLLIFV